MLTQLILPQIINFNHLVLSSRHFDILIHDLAHSHVKIVIPAYSGRQKKCTCLHKYVSLDRLNIRTFASEKSCRTVRNEQFLSLQHPSKVKTKIRNAG